MDWTLWSDKEILIFFSQILNIADFASDSLNLVEENFDTSTGKFDFEQLEQSIDLLDRVSSTFEEYKPNRIPTLTGEYLSSIKTEGHFTLKDPSFFGNLNNLYTIIRSIFDIAENSIETHLNTTEIKLVRLTRKILHKCGYSSSVKENFLYFYIPFHIFKINEDYFGIETPNTDFISIITVQTNSNLIFEFWNEIKSELG